jgi:tryptophan synthase alpha chain
MSRIPKSFAALKQRGEAALIPFITAGDPDLATTLKIMRALEAGGADAIELGIPFSDPADGPTIQRSSERALKNLITLPAIFRLVREFRRSSELPIILFGYYNPFFSLRSRQVCQSSGAPRDGVLCSRLAAGRERASSRIARIVAI